MKRMVLWAGVCLSVAGCSGGGGGGKIPTAPSLPNTQQNRAPVINSLSISPGFGIANITSFAYAVSASDPDSDSVSYQWNVAGNSASGSSGQILFSNGFEGTASVTVTDGKGGSVSDSRTFTVGSMSGNWTGSNSTLGTFTMALTQTATFITGTYADGSSFGAGKTDPSQPGIVRADGSFEIRLKQGSFTDFTFRGSMDNTGRRLTGGIFGSGFSGQPFVMVK